MVFKSYPFQILLRLLLIVLNCFGVLYVWQLQAYWLSFFNLLFLVVVQIYLLFRYLMRWQQDVRVFSNSVRHGDYTITYPLVDKHDPHFELYQMLNHINAYVRQIKSEYVQQNHYFQYVVENAQVGLIAYDDRGKIVLANAEALRLIDLPETKNILELKRIEPELFDLVRSETLNQSRLVVSARDRSVKLSVRLSRFVIDQRTINLVSIMNIRPELEENELQSWQELISVLTHEIMNSITPIHSLNGSMLKYMDKISDNEEIVAKAKHSLDVINRRSQSLMSFVDRYRQISTVPLPHKQVIDIGTLIEDVLHLMVAELTGVDIVVSHHHEKIEADGSLIEQVVINLIRNAASAFDKTEKRLDVKVFRLGQNIIASIRDNGRGIAPEVLDKVFIPFFTTRDGGSGIGLTLSRQIMHRHGGSINIKSVAGSGTEILLQFKATE